MKSLVVHLIKKYRLGFAYATAALYAAAIALIVLVFPDVSNLWVSVFILASGFTASITALSDLLVSADEASNHDEK